jgi:hypothetical protein
MAYDMPYRMDIRCCECGRRVALKLVDGKWEPQRCGQHHDAKRYSASFAKKKFDAMREKVK